MTEEELKELFRKVESYKIEGLTDDDELVTSQYYILNDGMFVLFDVYERKIGGKSSKFFIYKNKMNTPLNVVNTYGEVKQFFWDFLTDSGWSLDL